MHLRNLSFMNIHAPESDQNWENMLHFNMSYTSYTS